MKFIKVNWNLRNEFWDWCENLGCQPEHQGVKDWYFDLWQIPDEKVYLLAKLRWHEH